MSKFFEFHGVLWRQSSGIVEPSDLGADVDLQCIEFKSFPSVFLFVRWIKSFSTTAEKLWLVASSSPLSENDLSQNTRSKVRRGQRNFEIKPISRDFLKQNGFDVQKRLWSAGKRKRIKPGNFVREIDNLPPNYEFLGVFERQTGEFVGYSQVFVGQKFVNLRVISILPQANRRYASYAFYFYVNHRYVAGQGKTVVLGIRSLVGRSNVQDFVMEKFGYERLYVKFQVCLSFLGRILFVVLKPFRPILRIFRKVGVIRLIYAYLEFILLAKS